MKKTIIQVFPTIKSGGLERGAIDHAIIAAESGFESIVIAKISDSVLTQKLVNANVKVINLDVGKKNIFDAYHTVKELKALFTELQPSCIHARSRLPIWLCYFALKELNIPLITSCHGVHDDGFLRLKKIYNRATVLGDMVIFPTITMLTHYKERFEVEPAKTTIIPPAIDTEYFSLKLVNPILKSKLASQWNLDSNKTTILLPGRITAWKGQKEFIEAIHLLPNDIQTSLQIILLGEIENLSYANECMTLINKYSLENCIQLIEHTLAMREAYALSDIVVSSSIEPESFGRVVCEAMSMQRLTLATNLGGSLETIVDGKTGLLTKASPDAMIASLTELLTLNEQSKQEIKRNARRHVERKFSKNNCDGKMLGVYEKLSRPNN